MIAYVFYLKKKKKESSLPKRSQRQRPMLEKYSSTQFVQDSSSVFFPQEQVFANGEALGIAAPFPSPFIFQRHEAILDLHQEKLMGLLEVKAL